VEPTLLDAQQQQQQEVPDKLPEASSAIQQPGLGPTAEVKGSGVQANSDSSAQGSGSGMNPTIIGITAAAVVGMAALAVAGMAFVVRSVLSRASKAGQLPQSISSRHSRRRRSSGSRGLSTQSSSPRLRSQQPAFVLNDESDQEDGGPRHLEYYWGANSTSLPASFGAYRVSSDADAAMGGRTYSGEHGTARRRTSTQQQQQQQQQQQASISLASMSAPTAGQRGSLGSGGASSSRLVIMPAAAYRAAGGQGRDRPEDVCIVVEPDGVYKVERPAKHSGTSSACTETSTAAGVQAAEPLSKGPVGPAAAAAAATRPASASSTAGKAGEGVVPSTPAAAQQQPILFRPSCGRYPATTGAASSSTHAPQPTAPGQPASSASTVPAAMLRCSSMPAPQGSRTTAADSLWLQPSSGAAAAADEAHGEPAWHVSDRLAELRFQLRQELAGGSSGSVTLSPGKRASDGCVPGSPVKHWLGKPT
jgi:hypothetical protein